LATTSSLIKNHYSQTSPHLADKLTGKNLSEWIWVTDNERIEKVVYDVRTAVLNSDPENVLAHLTEDVRYSGLEISLSSGDTLSLIRNNVSNIHLEFARISELTPVIRISKKA
jgi:hypothetical protein